jgi:uncharacterized membrane protein YjgN (DUF898 family)
MEASTVSPTLQAQPEIYRFEFRGKAGEYFRIWIVNVVLSILTLGIFSAWAKVRARRYFYGNTYLNGSSFDYHADPVKILKGRIIFGVFAALYSAGNFYTPLRAIIILFLLAFPWLLVRGMIFNNTNTSYRGVRFGFEKDYKGSYRSYFKGMAYSFLSLGILGGVAMFFHEQFRVTRSSFGHTKFTFTGEKWPYWRIYATSFVFVIAAIVWLIASMAIGKLVPWGGKTFSMVVSFIVGFGGFYAILGFIMAYIRANASNYVFKHTKLGGIQLRSKYNSFDLYLIYLGNFFVTALTLGLAYPWARIELAKYRATTTAVEARAGDFDAFIQAESAAGGSVGDQVLDFWDIDLGF